MLEAFSLVYLCIRPDAGSLRARIFIYSSRCWKPSRSYIYLFVQMLEAFALGYIYLFVQILEAFALVYLFIRPDAGSLRARIFIYSSRCWKPSRSGIVSVSGSLTYRNNRRRRPTRCSESRSQWTVTRRADDVLGCYGYQTPRDRVSQDVHRQHHFLY